MELKVQRPVNVLGNGRVLSPSRVINPLVQQNNLSYNTPDVSLRDKTRLLQLAERIQTKKSSSFNATPVSVNRSQYNASCRLDKSIDAMRNNGEMNQRNDLENGTTNLEQRLMSNVGSSIQKPSLTSTPLRAPSSSFKKSFTRSKLYSSFSPSKKSNRLLKSDPAKTNIEHLVNIRNERKPESSPPTIFSNGFNNNELQSNHVSFHDKAKLASAFSPQQSQSFQKTTVLTPNERNSKLKSSRTKYGLGHQTVTSHNLGDNVGFVGEGSYGSNLGKCAHHRLMNDDHLIEDEPCENPSTAEARLQTLPRISSASIIALNKKPGMTSSTTSQSVRTEADTNDESHSITQPSTRHKSVISETEAVSQTHDFGEKHKNYLTSCSHNNNNDGVSDLTGFFSSMLTPSSGFSEAQNGHLGSLNPNYGNCGSSDSNKDPYPSILPTFQGVGKVLTKYTNPFLNPTLVESNCGSVYDPSSLNSDERRTCDDDENLTNLGSTAERENEINDRYRPNEELDCNSPEAEEEFNRKNTSSQPRTLTSMKNGIKNVILPGIWNGGEQTFERFERRPSQPPPLPPPSQDMRRRTLTLKSEFNPSAQIDTAVKMRTNGTEVRPQSLDYSQRKAWIKVYRDMEITSAQSAAVQTIDRSFSEDSTNSVALSKSEILNCNLQRPDLNAGMHTLPIERISRISESSSIGSNSPKSNSSGGSLFQRFSKTFSLRFGNTSSGSKDDRITSSTRKKIRNLTSGSSPDIFNTIKCDPNRVVDPSSGKFRTKLRKSTRENKCYSNGDSGIQIQDEYQNGIVRKLQQTPRQYSRQSLISTEIDNVPNSTQTPSELPVPVSPTSMKKLSLVEIPNYTWDQAELNSVSNTTTPKDLIVEQKLPPDDNLISSNDEILPCDHKNHKTLNNYNSLPLNYSRTRKSNLIEKRNINSTARNLVINELLLTEKNYIKLLNDIIHGFLIPCRNRIDLFNEKLIFNIFSNIENILKLHEELFNTLNSVISDSGNESSFSYSSIGHVFIKLANKFELYSDYCYHNPMSNAIVRQLTLNQEYIEFFETCRKLQLMVKLPLHGFLLRPIQRICQYHLQLNELLKNTEPTHPDYENIKEAVQVMKLVAMNINDTQRQFDSLQEIVRLQASIYDNWNGPDLLESNTIILYKGDLIKCTQGQKYKETFVIILNNEVLICKKDSNKKGNLSFNCRIDLRDSVWVNIDSNYEDAYFGMVHNSFRIYHPFKSTWILFTAQSPSDKKHWIKALENTCQNYPINLKMIEIAKITAIKLMLTENQQKISNNSYNSTLPKIKKIKKIKNESTQDELIDNGKLLRRSNNYRNSETRKASKFYV